MANPLDDSRDKCQEDDCISRLPEDIRIQILSYLSLKEAGQTSVLSTRWRYLWQNTRILNLDASAVVTECWKRRNRDGMKYLERERSRYVNWVNQVVNSYRARGSAVDEFRVAFDLVDAHKCDIDRWIDFVTEKRVQRFELNLRTARFCNDAGYILLSNNVLGWGSLTHLRLRNVNVNGVVLQYLLNNSQLQNLCVQASPGLGELKVSGSSLPLKHLEIIYCNSLRNLEISAPNLISFKYVGSPVCLFIKRAPLLVNVCIAAFHDELVSYAFTQPSSYLSQLETLELKIFCTKRHWDFPPKLSNLKHLILKVDAYDDDSLLDLTFLIEASPFLNKLTLKLKRIQTRLREVREVIICRHQHLKVVELLNFDGRALMVELAMYLFQGATSLEKIIVDARDLPTNSIMKRAARECARDLHKKYCPSVELVVY